MKQIPDKVIKQIQARISALESVPFGLETAAERQQIKLYKLTLRWLNGLDVVDGALAATSANYSATVSLGNTLMDSFSGDYQDALREYGRSFSEQAAGQIELMKGLGAKVRQESYESMITVSRNRAVDLFGSDELRSRVVAPVQKILTDSINSKVTVKDSVDILERELLGTAKAEGRMLGYIKGQARDAFSSFDRAFGELVSADAGIEFYQYSRGELKDSREFCKEREGNYYHINEIRSWASKDWQGKNANTNAQNITTYLGGYNCMHILLPQPLPFVPQKDVERAINKGFYKPKTKEDNG